MWLVLAENAPRPLIAWLMLALVALLLGGILVGWLLGRLFGTRSSWGKPLSGGRDHHAPEPPVDAWTESAKRLDVERTDEDATS